MSFGGRHGYVTQAFVGPISLMNSMTSRIMKLVARVLLGTCLMLVTASPALAEVGRAQDVLLHDQQISSARPHSAGKANHSNRGSTAPGKAPRCAFNHCAHAASIGLFQGAAPNPIALSLSYVRFVPDRHLAAARDGPDHPPRA